MDSCPPFEVVSTSACTPKVKRSRSMFADVMVRVIGVSYFTSVPSTVSEPEDSNPLRRCLLLLTGPEHHRDAGYIGIPLTVQHRRTVQQHAF